MILQCCHETTRQTLSGRGVAPAYERWPAPVYCQDAAVINSSLWIVGAMRNQFIPLPNMLTSNQSLSSPVMRLPSHPFRHPPQAIWAMVRCSVLWYAQRRTTFQLR
jgi:hypothetical protein